LQAIAKSPGVIIIYRRITRLVSPPETELDQSGFGLLPLLFSHLTSLWGRFTTSIFKNLPSDSSLSKVRGQDDRFFRLLPAAFLTAPRPFLPHVFFSSVASNEALLQKIF
jgi:hypothetical protein